MSETKETIVCSDSKGSIHIAEDVVASIAALAAIEVDGVDSLSAGMDITELLGKKNLYRGVKISLEETTVSVTVSLLIKYGYSITTVASKVQQGVAKAIESMTGLTAGAIHINVTGIAFDKSKSGK